MRISEIFLSIQGEGVGIGAPTVFVRLYGCDLRCAWCDTMYAVEGGEFATMSLDEVKAEIGGKLGCKRVCVTGGEPLLQEDEVSALTGWLLDNGYNVMLETSGHRAPPEIFSDPRCVVSLDCKCPGSGMDGRMDFSLITGLGAKDQLKFVIADEADYLYARGVLESCPTEAGVVFQPVYGKGLRWLAERVLSDGLGSVRVLPQLHKIMWGDRKGV